MHTTVSIEIRDQKYGATITSAEIDINADGVDGDALSNVVIGMIKSACNKARNYVPPARQVVDAGTGEVHPTIAAALPKIAE
jgi:hypothetical protein